MPDGSQAVPPLVREILAGLQQPQKTLPAKLFYDEEGCRLFGEITRLPEYYPTRTELALLKQVAPQLPRIDGGSLIPHAKAGGQYLNSVLAKIESVKAGYQEAILLDNRGFVCEGTGENIYIVRDGEIVTPPQTASILDGINRRSIITIATDLGYTVTERDLARAADN